MVLFRADPASDKWRSYLEYLDEMVVEGLFGCISHSLQFFVDNMESCSNQAPLFEAQLVLSSPGIVFLPSLEQDAGDGLYELIEGLIGDIFKTSRNVNRVAAHLGMESYQVLLQIWLLDMAFFGQCSFSGLFHLQYGIKQPQCDVNVACQTFKLIVNAGLLQSQQRLASHSFSQIRKMSGVLLQHLDLLDCNVSRLKPLDLDLDGVL